MANLGNCLTINGLNGHFLVIEGANIDIATTGTGEAATPVVITIAASGLVGVGGGGTDNHIMRWDGTSAAQDSLAQITDFGGVLTPTEYITGTDTTPLAGTDTFAIVSQGAGVPYLRVSGAGAYSTIDIGVWSFTQGANDGALMPTTLTAGRAWTLPDLTGTVLLDTTSYGDFPPFSDRFHLLGSNDTDGTPGEVDLDVTLTMTGTTLKVADNSIGTGQLTLTNASRILGSGSGGANPIELAAERGLSIDADGIGVANAGITVGMVSPSGVNDKALVTRSGSVIWDFLGQGDVANLSSDLSALYSAINDFRLTGVTATPVMTSSTTGLSTIYLTPYSGNRIALYTGSAWQLFASAEVSLAVTGRTTDLPFDIFAYASGGTVTLEFLDWTNATTRATALTRQDGVTVKSGDATRRWVGTCRPRSATTFDWRFEADGNTVRLDLFNAENRVPTYFRQIASTNSWNYTTATWRQAQASGNYQVEVVIGWQDTQIDLSLQCSASNGSASVQRSVALGYDSTTTPSGVYMTNTGGASQLTGLAATLNHQPAIGRHFYSWLEYSVAGVGTTTFYGDNGGNVLQSGITGHITI